MVTDGHLAIKIIFRCIPNSFYSNKSTNFHVYSNIRLQSVKSLRNISKIGECGRKLIMRMWKYLNDSIVDD